MNESMQIDDTQTYIVDNVERLLIELAHDSSLSAFERLDRTQVICQLIIHPVAKVILRDRLLSRHEDCADQQPYTEMIEILKHQTTKFRS